mmetsp:Transcript_23391/g.65272  ORF Transcript_23391/g.65272 Transcript_23391/m.65272 type:complete len:231 (+) Transcript_23391:2508-3200(+)
MGMAPTIRRRSKEDGTVILVIVCIVRTIHHVHGRRRFQVVPALTAARRWPHGGIILHDGRTHGGEGGVGPPRVGCAPAGAAILIVLQVAWLEGGLSLMQLLLRMEDGAGIVRRAWCGRRCGGGCRCCRDRLVAGVAAVAVVVIVSVIIAVIIAVIAVVVVRRGRRDGECCQIQAAEALTCRGRLEGLVGHVVVVVVASGDAEGDALEGKRSAQCSFLFCLMYNSNANSNV